MSFLDDIKKFSNKKLKTTETKILTPDGREIKETKTSSGRYLQEQVGDSGLGFVGDYKPDLQVGEVIPRLFISSQDVAADLKILNSLKITHILNLASLCENIYEDLFTYKSLNILDLPTEDITQYFEECFQFIDQAYKDSEENKILVHCNAGVSRSSTIVIAYLMKTKCLNFTEAFDMVKSKRNCIRPNDGFLHQLKSYLPKT